MSEETQVTQETSNLEATPAQDTSSSTSTPKPTETSKPDTATTKPEDTWEYNGDRNNVPESMKKYVAGLDRYVSKRDQARIELEKKVQDYETKLAQFKDKSTTQPTGTVEPSEPSVTQEEAEAIMLGDAKTLQKVIQREAKHLLEAGNPNVTEKLSALENRQKELDAAELIKSFTEVNPDFSELLKSPLGDFMVDAARKGMSIEQIHKSAQQIKSFFTDAADSKRKADFEKKKQGSVVGKTITGTPDVVLADNEDHAKRLAIEMTLKGDTRRVQVKTQK